MFLLFRQERNRECRGLVYICERNERSGTLIPKSPYVTVAFAVPESEPSVLSVLVVLKVTGFVVPRIVRFPTMVYENCFLFQLLRGFHGHQLQ